MKLATLLGWVVVGTMVATTGCAVDSEESEDVGSDSQPVIGGTETREAPEVGKVSFSWGSYCTATLIAPRVAITAAHCVRYATRDVTGSYGRFIIQKLPTGTQSFVVDRYRAFPREGLGEVDVALLRLRDPVPADVARPAPLATSLPPSGTGLKLYGYGCNDDWEHQTGGGTKRAWQYSYGQTFRDRLCPGDSGGPVRVRSTGAVLLINSGWVSNWLGKRDVFGDVPRHVALINAQQQAWSLPEPTTGLRAEYFDVQDLKGDPKVSRVDRTVDFDWGSGSPISVVEKDTFSVRWQGKLVPATTETYTLEVYSDDGVRLWIDDQIVIDDWNAHSPASRTGRVALTAGQSHAIRLEYFEGGGGAVAKLFWSSASQSRQIIPSSRLKPN